MSPDVLVLLALLACLAVLAFAGVLLVAYAEAPIPTPETTDLSRGTQPPGSY